jgi:putative transposase
MRLPTAKLKQEDASFMSMNDINSLSHTKWNCKYHIVLAPKYRRKVFFKQKKAAIGKILRELCEWKGVKIVEAEICPDHIHMLVEIPPKISVSSFMGYLKGESRTMLYKQFGELKYKYRSREFWCKGYYVDTVGKNERRIAEYIRNQLKEDMANEQLTMPLTGPFTGK